VPLCLQIEKRERKDSAGSDDTASLIEGEGYVGARTRQPPTAKSHKRRTISVGQGGPMVEGRR
jgi:hypothetical protein